MTARTTGNLADLVRDAAVATPDKAALVFHGDTVTWGELDAQVSAAARGLLALGAAPGDRVAVHLGNTPEFPVVYFGALRAGLVALPVNTGYTADELAHVLGDSGARVVVTTSITADTVRAVDADLTVVVAGSPSYDELVATDGDLDSVGGGEDLAVVLYTSGTSGRPKGAMLTHRALLANLEQTSRIDPPVVSPDDVVLLVLPLFHIFGLNAALGSVAWHGATGVLAERFDPVETLGLLRRHGVTNVVGAPPMYVAWSMLPDVGDAFATVRLALSGAAPLPPTVLHRVLDVTGHHVFEGYGLTETAPVLTTTLMSEVAKAGSIGRPVPGVELRLLDERGRPVEEGDPGEVVVRGANLFSGYWPDGADGPDADGWLPTGDVAVLDDDGDLHLVDRRRELILVSGFNVYPREVEEVIATHPDVEEVAVIGIPHPYTGESVKALIVLRAGAVLTADEVVAHSARALARFKCPTAVEFVPELPHSATGKVSKGRLRELSA
ncbi:MAG: AMP-dependent synthetase and ligase [Frankiales bacterium]|nr:AMP-dependent synthetase and ligase [Frankiales bacterium]